MNTLPGKIPVDVYSEESSIRNDLRKGKALIMKVFTHLKNPTIKR